MANSFLDVIMSETDRMTHIVQDLLTLSKLDYGRTEMNYTEFSAKDMSVGYILQSTASTPLALVPVWKISSDSYTYYVNSSDGSVELACRK